MHPELITLPGGFTIKTYGFFLMAGFLTAVWMAMRRGARVKIDSDRVLDVSFILLISGVAGARIFYVVHYWESQFADRTDRLWAIVDIRQGGLEFLGGLLGATAGMMIYLAVKKQSIRLFLDVAAPSAMWGLGIGRIGCFFNGCCFGGVCVTGSGSQPRYPWAVRFPYGSAAHVRQWEDRQVTLPAELISAFEADLLPAPLLETHLSMSPERRDRPQRTLQDLKKALQRATAESADPKVIAEIKGQLESQERIVQEHESELRPLLEAQRFPSRVAPERHTLVSELQDLAAGFPSLPVHPVQLYAAASALLLSGFLSAVFYRRKRHGMVIGLLFVTYPLSRVLEELIRTDNPHDVAGLTISQFISVSMFVLGVVYLYVLYTRFPERSPYALAAMPQEPVPVAEEP